MHRSTSDRLMPIVAMVLTILVSPADSTPTSLLFKDSFEDQFGIPESDQQAARFLMQTTFGVKRSEISPVGQRGYRGWIRWQEQLPQTRLQPRMHALAAAQLAIDPDAQVAHRDRQRYWHENMVTAPDQLRQRIGFALSEMFVLSENHPELSFRPTELAHYQDLLSEHAFGNYRELLGAITRNPQMGIYLSSIRNRGQKFFEETGLTVFPDENYGREVMQLFSIGVFERNQDYSLVDGDTSTPGVQPIETYDENVVANMARVFTGLGWRCTPGTVVINGVERKRQNGCRNPYGPNHPLGGDRSCEGSECNFIGRQRSRPEASESGIPHPDSYAPMICYPVFHDIGRDLNTGDAYPERPLNGVYSSEPYRDKRVVGYWPTADGSGTLPMFASECASLARAATLFNPPSDIAQRRDACVAYCDGEIEQVLDALFNHPNTAPTFARRMIQFFVTSNPSPQYITRVANVFDDNGAGERGDIGAVVEAILMDVEARQTPTDPNFGKVREPLIKLASLYRGMDYVSPNNLWGSAFGAGGVGKLMAAYGQAHLSSPTVFNFFSPNFEPAGPIGDQGLVAPEYQLYDESRVTLTSERYLTVVCSGYGTLTSGDTPNNNCATAGGQGNQGGGFVFKEPNGAYIPPAVLDSLPSDSEGLIEELNIRLLAGRMTGSFEANTGTKGVLRRYLEATANDPSDGDRKYRRMLSVIHLISLSAEFSVQR